MTLKYRSDAMEGAEPWHEETATTRGFDQAGPVIVRFLKAPSDIFEVVHATRATPVERPVRMTGPSSSTPLQQQSPPEQLAWEDGSAPTHDLPA